jgi:fluoride exporter
MRELLLSMLFVFIGGGTGSVFRFLVSAIIQKTSASHYPFGTLAVNVIGSFIIGFIIVYIESRSAEFPFWRQLLVIGFLGGFTTFSSFSWDTLALIKNHETTAAIINIGGNVLLCLIAAWLGSIAGKGAVIQ